MKRLLLYFKRLWQRVLNPSVVQAAIAFVVGCIFIAAAIVLSLNGINDVGAYFCYFFALLSLVYIGYICVYGFPKVKQRTLEFAARYEFTSNLVKNYGYRTVVIACASVALNAAYAVYNSAVALHYSALWNGLFAVYYILLCALRGTFLMDKRKKARALTKDVRAGLSAKKYVRCGIWLIMLTLLIVANIVSMSVAGAGRRQSGYLVIAAALYTFVRFGLAVRNIRKAKKQDDFSIKALRNIGFADALVALFVLQTSMLVSFGENHAGYAAFSRTMGIATGTAVCAIMVFMGIYMIVSGRRALKDEVKNV